MDNSPAHLKKIEIPNRIKELGFHFLLPPPNTTSQLQPNYLGINHELKKNYQLFWEEFYSKLDNQQKSMSNDNFYIGILQSLNNINQEAISHSWSIYKKSFENFKQQKEISRELENKLVPIIPEVSEEEEQEIEEINTINQNLTKIFDNYQTQEQQMGDLETNLCLDSENDDEKYQEEEEY